MSWIDCLKRGKEFGRSILMAGEHASADELSSRQKEVMHKPFKDKLFTFPIDLPSFMLNRYSVSAFNSFYYRKNLKCLVQNVIPYSSFFYPLDMIQEWNRGYGKKGFLQYQFVLPAEACMKGMVDILGRISKVGMASFLAVFKLFGAQNGLISFPMEGCTLALDFPVRDGIFSFLNELDQVVLDYGGRIYLTKDARMKAETFWRSYSNAGDFVDLISKYNPDYKFRSMLSDRLLITER